MFDRAKEVGTSVSKVVRDPLRGKDKEQQPIDIDTPAMDAVTPVAGKDKQPMRKGVTVTPAVVARATNGIDSIQTIPVVKGLGGQKKAPHTKPDKPILGDYSNPRPLVENRVKFGGIRMGLNVTPGFSDKGFSFGGGISVQVPISSRLSSEIGLSYRSLKTGIDMKADRTDTLAPQIIQTRSAVGMVAIPISVNYVVTENFSASLGIMPVRVVRDQRTDVLQSYRWVMGEGVPGDTIRRLVGDRTRLQRTDSLYKGNTYLGFIQLSGRYRPPFLKRYNVAIAPYIALPVGRLQRDQYKWIHGGVSLRIYLPKP